MATLTVDHREFEIDDDLYERFEALADTPEGRVGDDAVNAMRATCIGEYERTTLAEYLFIWREMTATQIAASVMVGCSTSVLQKYAAAGAKLRRRRRPDVPRITRIN